MLVTVETTEDKFILGLKDTILANAVSHFYMTILHTSVMTTVQKKMRETFVMVNSQVYDE